MSKHDEKIHPLIKLIEQYVKEDRVRQAFLINGEWGVGKTHLIQNELIPAINMIDKTPQGQSDSKVKQDISRVIYVSLYGVNSKNEIMQLIKDNFLANLDDPHKKTIEKVQQFIADKFKSNGTTKVQPKYFNTGSLVFQLAKTTIESTFVTIKNRESIVIDFSSFMEYMLQQKIVIIFDDLERCPMGILETLGFINNLVENNNVKVIIVANEARITDLYSSDEQTYQKAIYREIKEKTIGVTYLFMAQIDELYDSLVEDKCSSGEVVSFLNNHKNMVIQLFKTRNCSNVRTFIFFLISFDKIWELCHASEQINKECKIAEQFLKNLLFYTANECITCKSKKLESLSESDSEPSHQPSWNLTAIEMCRATGCDLEMANLEHYQFVSYYLDTQRLHQQYLDNHLKSVIGEMNKNSNAALDALCLKELLKWHLLEEEVLKEKLTQLTNELNNERYSARYFSKIVPIVLKLNHEKIVDFNIENLKQVIFNAYDVACSKEDDLTSYHEALRVANHYESHELESEHSNFVNQLTVITKYMMSSFLKDLNENILIDLIKNSSDNIGTEFLDYVNSISQNSTAIPVENCSLFKEVDVDKLLSLLNEGSLQGIYSFADAINVIYYSSTLRMVFQDDRKNIECFLNGINRLLHDVQIKSTRKLAYERLQRAVSLAHTNIMPKRV